MVTKGIITELVGSTQAKVRIPIYDRASSALDATPDSELSKAIICTFPGATPNYSVGDVVIVAFEQNIYTEPVIIGLLFTNAERKTFTDLNVGKLGVFTSARLPKNTYVGTTTPFDLQNLAGTRGNIQNQIDTLVNTVNQRTSRPAIVGEAIVGTDYVYDVIEYYIEPEDNNLVILGINQLLNAEIMDF